MDLKEFFLKALEKKEAEVKKQHIEDGEDLNNEDVVQSIKEEAYNTFLNIDELCKCSEEEKVKLVAGRMILEEGSAKGAYNLVKREYDGASFDRQLMALLAKEAGIKLFRIVPQFGTVTEVEALDEADAMEQFAFSMDSDMNTYFRAIPASQDEEAYVVCHYSFSEEVPIWKVKNYDDACSLIKAHYDEERKIQIEENGRIEGVDLKCSFAEYGDGYSYASITTCPSGMEDATMEWSIATLKN